MSVVRTTLLLVINLVSSTFAKQKTQSEREEREGERKKEGGRVIEREKNRKHQ